MDLEQVKYEAFFDELGHIEKRAMLEKVAVGSLVRAGMQFLRRPGKTFKSLGRIAKGGWEGTSKLAPEAKGVSGAAKALWKSPAGRLAIIGGGGAAGLGTAYGLGRGRSNQNVYVR